MPAWTLALALLGLSLWSPSMAAAQEGAAGTDVEVTAGQAFTRAVATFHSSTLETSAFQASITWGDGAPPSSGTIVKVDAGCPFPDRGCYEVRGSHTYATAGTRTIETSISGPDTPDGVVVQATATVNPPQPPPQTLVAMIQPKPQGGGLVHLDASASAGPITKFEFDLDGNGSHETDCGGPTASVAYGQGGPQTVGLKVTSPGGEAATTSQTLTPSAGASSPALGSVKAIGACGQKALTELLLCPTTLRFGTVELVFPDNAPDDACFRFARLPASKLLGSGSAQTVPAWRSPKDVWVKANGVTLRTAKTGNHLAATASPLGMRVVGLKGSPSSPLKVPLKTGGEFSMWLYEEPFSHLSVQSVAAPLNWDVAKAGVVQTAPGVDGDLLGLPLSRADTPLRLTAQAQAELKVRLEFPVKTLDQLIDKLGITSSPVGLRTTNDDGLELGSASASFGDIPLGVLTLRNLTIAYSSESGQDVWQGGVNALFAGGYELDGKIRFADGQLEGAEVFGTLPGLGIPLGCCIYLNGLGAGFDQDAIRGKARFIVPPDVLGIDWLLRADTNIEFSYKDPWRVEADGSFFVVGIPFATADMMIWPKGGWAQGIVEHDAGPFSVSVAAQLFVGSKWYASVSGSGCFDYIDGACITVAGAASSKAVTACGAVTSYLGLGGYFKWNGGAGIYFECSMGKVKSVAGVSQASGQRSFRVPPGLARVLLRFRGRADAPRVTVTAPGGRRYASPGGSGFATDDRTFLWVRDGRDTYLAVRTPPGGTWRVEEQPGSPALAAVGQALPLPKSPVRARLRGRAHRRVLGYRLKPVEGQTVTFFEVAGRGGPSQRIGRARSLRGSLRFAPAEGPAGPRRIVALLESSGLPRDTVTVARYRAPGPLRPARPRVRARRKGQGLALRWSRVPGVRRYRVAVRWGDGGGRVYETRRRRLRVGSLAPRAGARARVRGVTSTGLQGLWGSARVGALPSVSVPRRIRASELVRRGLTARCSATADGSCVLTLTRGRSVLGRGERAVRYNRTAAVRVRLTRRGGVLARRGGRLRLRALLPGEDERTLTVRVLR